MKFSSPRERARKVVDYITFAGVLPRRPRVRSHEGSYITAHGVGGDIFDVLRIPFCDRKRGRLPFLRDAPLFFALTRGKHDFAKNPSAPRRQKEREREIVSSTKRELAFCRPVRTSLTHLPTWDDIARPRVIVCALTCMRDLHTHTHTSAHRDPVCKCIILHVYECVRVLDSVSCR